MTNIAGLAVRQGLDLSGSPEQRTRVVGLWGVAGAGGLLGVALGGALTQSLGWEWVFWVPVPVGLAAAVVVLRAVPVVRASAIVLLAGLAWLTANPSTGDCPCT